MKLAPCLYVVTVDHVITPACEACHAPSKAGGYYYIPARPFAVTQPTVVYATTSRWLAKLVAWWYHGNVIYDNQALQEHNAEFDDYTS